MVLSRRIIMVAAVSAVFVGVAALAVGARAQPQPAERIVGYSVYAHSQHVLLQRADGAMRVCKIGRQTAINTRPQWECDTLPPLP